MRETKVVMSKIDSVVQYIQCPNEHLFVLRASCGRESCEQIESSADTIIESKCCSETLPVETSNVGYLATNGKHWNENYVECSKPSVRNNSILEALPEESRNALQLRCKRLILDHIAEEEEMGIKAFPASYNKICPNEYGEKKRREFHCLKKLQGQDLRELVAGLAEPIPSLPKEPFAMHHECQ